MACPPRACSWRTFGAGCAAPCGIMLTLPLGQSRTQALTRDRGRRARRGGRAERGARRVNLTGKDLGRLRIDEDSYCPGMCQLGPEVFAAQRAGLAPR